MISPLSRRAKEKKRGARTGRPRRYLYNDYRRVCDTGY